MTCEMAYLEEQRNSRYSAMGIRIKELEAQLADRDARIKELEAQLAERDLEIGRLTNNKQGAAFPRDGKISVGPIAIPKTWREKYAEDEER